MNWLLTVLNPLRLPFSVPALTVRNRILVGTAVRWIAAYFFGPLAYFVARGRVGVAIALYGIQVVFALFDRDQLGHQVSWWIVGFAELLQTWISVRLILANPKPVELEEIEIVDEKGNYIETIQRPISTN